LEIDFVGKRVWGNVLYKFRSVREGAEERIILDTRFVPNHLENIP
jgi:hypothetical protein